MTDDAVSQTSFSLSRRGLRLDEPDSDVRLAMADRNSKAIREAMCNAKVAGRS